MAKVDLRVPGDKSISHRAVMLGALARGETIIRNYLASADCLATIDCFRKLGIDCAVSNTELRVRGRGLKGLTEAKEPLDVGNSGTTIRLITGILAGQSFTTKITGDTSIQRRPMGRIAKPLRMMNANITGVERHGEIYAPLQILGGELEPIAYELPVASAQVKSAVLLAGLFAQGETSVIEKNQSRDHTERMLEHFGAKIKVVGPLDFARGKLQSSVIGRHEFNGAEVDVPGDISSAAFFLVAGLITPNSELRLLNVGVNPTRTGIIDVLHRMGANLTVENERLISGEPRADLVVRSSALRAVRIDGEIIPRLIDELPIIAVAASQAEGTTEIRGAKELRVKESDRIKTVATELRKLGAKIEELEDGLVIHGPTKLTGAEIESHGDHRIAMSAAVAGLITEGKAHVTDTACIETSFPGFEKFLNTLK